MPPEVLTDGLKFPEGPVWAPDGTLYVTEIQAGCITAITADGAKRTFADTGGAPNGAALGSDGYLYVTNNGGRDPGCIQRIDSGGKVEVVYDSCQGQPFQGPNDLVMDAHGGFYFTDPGMVSREGLHIWSCVLRAPRRQPRHPPAVPVLSAERDRPDPGRYGSDRVGVGHRPGVRQIPIQSPGVLGQVDAGARSGAPRSWPGRCPADQRAAAGRAGRHVSRRGRQPADLRHNGGVVSIHEADGSPLEPIRVEDPRLTNCCFGGPDLQTLYITESGLGRVVSVRWQRPGLRLNDQ